MCLETGYVYKLGGKRGKGLLVVGNNANVRKEKKI